MPTLNIWINDKLISDEINFSQIFNDFLLKSHGKNAQKLTALDQIIVKVILELVL